MCDENNVVSLFEMCDSFVGFDEVVICWGRAMNRINAAKIVFVLNFLASSVFAMHKSESLEQLEQMVNAILDDSDSPVTVCSLCRKSKPYVRKYANDELVCTDCFVVLANDSDLQQFLLNYENFRGRFIHLNGLSITSVPVQILELMQRGFRLNLVVSECCDLVVIAQGKCIHLFGNIKISNCPKFQSVGTVDGITGDIEINNCGLTNLGSLEYVVGSVRLERCYRLQSLAPLWCIGYNLSIVSCSAMTNTDSITDFGIKCQKGGHMYIKDCFCLGRDVDQRIIFKKGLNIAIPAPVD